MIGTIVGLAVLGTLVSQATMNWENSGEMRQLCIQYRADNDALSRMYNFDYTPNRYARFAEFRNAWRKQLDSVNFYELPEGGRADWVLLRNNLNYEDVHAVLDQEKLEEARPLIPFLDLLVALHEQRIGKMIPSAEESGEALSDLQKSISDAKKELEKKLKAFKEKNKDGDYVPEFVAKRAISILGRATQRIEDWNEYYTGYDPMFTWWTKRPYEDAHKALEDYRKFLTDNLTKPDDSEGGRIVGDPIGAEGLKADLEHEMIAYTPEELIDIAKQEMKWCDAEALKAAKQMGCKTYLEALEKVKNMHEEPGNQTKLIVELAQEAVDYVTKNDLVTVPDLAKQVWRVDMMSPQRQLVSPFFLGGESIQVSFPTDSMTHEQKLMSMRGNNRYFSKATVHHELIPGHHLQGFMMDRYNTHREGVTDTPFWIEGWALYWEFLLYKRGFAATPEEKIGFLFWRKHRCARIIFSLSFHLGKMTPQQCVDMLVNDVGHEKSTAEGEVRRSFGGDYPPLYQAAYMLGALQIWQLRRELVDTGKMREKNFHDAILQNGSMPISMLRAILEKGEIVKGWKNDWRFYHGPAE